MNPGGYTAQVTNLSKRATEIEVRNFFAHCGVIERIEIIRSGKNACSAYVSFRDAYALETAVLLSGAKIVDQYICVLRWGSFIDEYDPYHAHNMNSENHQPSQFVSTPGEAVTIAQDVVKTMVSKGYILGKDALIKAKELDNSYGLSAAAAAKIAELSSKIGLTSKINAVKSVNEKYHVSDYTISAATFTGKTALAAATATGRTAASAAVSFRNSTYFANGAQWVSGVLTSAAKSAADMGQSSGK